MMAHTVHVRQRPMFGGAGPAIECMASMGAPLSGGVITEKISLRWCFYINLPNGTITFILVCLFHQDAMIISLSSLSLKVKIRRSDLVGAAVYVRSIIFPLLALR